MIRILGKDVPTELRELVDPRHTALLIIDMQNDYCAPAGGAGVGGADLSMYEDIIPRIARIAALCRETGIPVVNVHLIALPGGGSDSPAWTRLRMRANDQYDPDGPVWHFTVAGSWGARFVDGLTPQPGDVTVTKYRSSAFANTDLDLYLRSNGISTVLVSGCTTEGCVESTVRDATSHDYFPVLLADCVGSDQRDLHEASMLVMSAYRADVTTSDEVEHVLRTGGTDLSAVGAVEKEAG
jgi:nicotinamidase-related amidase